MANEKNLIPYNQRTPSERRAIAQKAGIASGVARRGKKSLAELARMIADNPASAKNKEALNKLGIKGEDATNNAVVASSVYSSALRGNMAAVDKWEKYVAESGAEDEHYELPARVIGKDFVDINRHIEPNKSYDFEGGRGGLKSAFIGFKIVELIKNNPMMHACAVRQTKNTLKDSVYTTIVWAINTLGLADEFKCTTSPLEIKYIKTGQIIYFRGLDDEQKLKSIKPPFGYIGILWKEEKDQIRGPEAERSVNQSVLRGGAESYDFASFNPPKSKDAWVNKQIIEDENHIVHHSCYLDAPPEWLGKKFLQDAEHLKEVNPEAYEHEYLGIPNGEGGSIFEFVEVREITQEEVNGFDRIYQGVDWGWYPDPYAFVRLHYDASREIIYPIDEHFVNKQSNTQTGEWIKEKKYNDFTITCDSAEHKSTGDYRDMGLDARNAIKGPGSVEYGMKWLQSRKFVIDPRRTPNLYKEIINYEYDRDKDGNVISGYPDANNHGIDAIRYALERVWRRRENHG